METPHAQKRRRLDDAISEASSDELGGANSDIERRRASWVKQMQNSAYKPSPRAYQPARREAEHHSESESPDELAADVTTPSYWHRTRISSQTPRPQMRSRRMSRQSRREEGVEGGYEDGDGAGFASDDESRAESMDDQSMRSPTPRPMSPPPPPPPPPKPERLYYKEKFVLKGHYRGVSTAKFSPNGSMIASCGADATIKIWDTATGKLMHTFEGHLAGISTLSWSPDGKILASGSDDKSIRLWNVLTGKPHPTPLLGHHNYIYSIAFSPKGNMIVSGSYDEAVFLWDVRSARVMRSLPAHSDPVAAVDVIRDGTLIASCSTDGLIRIWDTATGQCLRTLVHEDNPPVTAVKFSPNGKFVLAWSLDGCVRLWNYVEGRCIKTYQGHKNEKFSVSGGFGTYNAPGGPSVAFAASGSEDGAVVCWDVVGKKVLQKLEGHTDVVLGVDTYATPESKLIVSCGLDRTVRVWEETPGGSEEQAQNDDQEEQKPDEKPEDEKPEDEKPEDEKPEDEKPEDEKPEDEKPEEQTLEANGVEDEVEADVDVDGDTAMG